MALGPLRIGVGGVNEVQAVVDERVKDGERRALIGRPAEYIAAEDEGCDLKIRGSDGVFLHRFLRLVLDGNEPKRIRANAAARLLTVRDIRLETSGPCS